MIEICEDFVRLLERDNDMHVDVYDESNALSRLSIVGFHCVAHLLITCLLLSDNACAGSCQDIFS